MTSHQGDKNANPDSKRPLDSQAEDDSAEQPKAKPARQKLAAIGHYLMLGFAPVVSVAALGVAVFAVTGNQSGEAQLGKTMAKIDNLNASQAASKSEVDRLKLAMAQEKGLQEEERKKLDERLTKIVQNITPIQAKLKFTPTLEDQLRQAAGASAVSPAAASGVPAAQAVATATDKKASPQVKGMKDAIEKYNKK